MSPDQSGMLLQGFARGVVEAKIFVDKHGAFHMSLGVPLDCILNNETVKNVPIVFRNYTETHACAAVCRSFTTSTGTLEFKESWDVLDASTWQGMTVDQLMPHIPYMQGHFQVEWHAAQSQCNIFNQAGRAGAAA